MHSEVISKKELLDEMNISYGQLYRWKRKKLIPEEWFIKKSVSTGQETFFPREKTIERIKYILELKDDVSLEEIASMFTYNAANLNLSKDVLIEQEIISLAVMERFEAVIKANSVYDEKMLFILFLYDSLITLGTLNLNEVNEVTLSILNSYDKLDRQNHLLIVKRKLGVFFYYVLSPQDDVLEDTSSTTLTKIAFKDILSKISKLR